MSPGVVVGVIIAVLAVVGMALFAVGPTSREISVAPVVTLGPPQDTNPAEATILDKRESGGLSVFGLQIRGRTHRINVYFYELPGCFGSLTFSDPWPTTDGRCSNPVAVTGEVSGFGVAATGESIVGVEVEVSADCYEALTPGDMWPSPAKGCSAVSGG